MKCTNSYITWIKRAAAAVMAAVLMLSATACAEEDALSAVASVPVAKELEMNEEAVASGTVTEDKGVLTFAMKKPVDSFFPLGEMDEDLPDDVRSVIAGGGAGAQASPPGPEAGGGISP